MNRDTYIRLYEKYFSGTCSPEEMAMLDAYMDDFELIEREWETGMGSKEQVRQTIYKQLLSEIHAAPQATVVTMKNSSHMKWLKISAAAILLLIAGSATYFILKKPIAKQQLMASIEQRYKNDVAPGKSGAILTLSDGTKVVLDSAKNGMIATQGNTPVVYKDGELSYAHTKSTEVLYNTLTVPLGRQGSVTLSDNTVVWLNAGSSIKYPVTFTGDLRTVEITGEVYFEVFRDQSQPFLVSKPNSNLKVLVLGTHFNVNAYDDEKAIKVTLLEGSVKVFKGKDSALLKPGQQAQITGKNITTVNNVDVNEAVAWKNGLFQFGQADIHTIMRQLARWYDVDVVYEGEVSTQEFWLGIPSNLSLSNVLKALEKSNVHFRIEGRKIIVMP